MIDKELLLRTKYDDLLKTFPGYTRRELLSIKKGLLPVKEKKEPSFNEVVFSLLKTNKKLTVEEMSDYLNTGVSRVRQAVQELQNEGKNILVGDTLEFSNSIPHSKPTRIDTSKFKGKKIVFGLTADNHLGSKYARMDVLNALFDIWEKQGVKTVYQLGNMIDGEARFNKFDLLVPPGVEAQINYFVENWPKRKGMVTEFVTGDDHEGWYVRDHGLNIGKLIEHHAKEAGREDIKFLGHMEHDVLLSDKNPRSFMRLTHAGGGSSYATSYSVQKIVESYQGGEKPAILLVGHYHKAEYGYPREVHCIQAGCTEDQTPFMRKLKIQAHVGGWTVSFELDDNGFVHAFTPQFHPFYDREFYENKQWGYKWE